MERFNALGRGAQLMLVGAVLLLIDLFLPWQDFDVGGLADELGYVQRLLENLGDELVVEPLILHRYARSLQSMDLAGQILGHVAAIINAQDKSEVIEQIGMEDLRARLKRKAIG